MKTVLSGLLGYGALIECLQALTPYRFAEWLDLLADALGLAPGRVLAKWPGRHGSHRIAHDAAIRHRNS